MEYSVPLYLFFSLTASVTLVWRHYKSHVLTNQDTNLIWHNVHRVVYNILKGRKLYITFIDFISSRQVETTVIIQYWFCILASDFNIIILYHLFYWSLGNCVMAKPILWVTQLCTIQNLKKLSTNEHVLQLLFMVFKTP